MSDVYLDQGNLLRLSAETVFPKLATPLVDEALAQAKSIVREPSPEGLHQLRIALRRLRSLWWAYGPLLEAGETARQRKFFSSLASSAGKARDYDILGDLINQQQGTRGKGLPPQFAMEREKALHAGREVFANPEMETLLLDAISQTSRTLQARPDKRTLKAFANARLAACERNLRKRMRRAEKAGASDVEVFHEVRKTGKKVRYLLELFSPVLSKRRRKSLEGLKEIQQQFGKLNDVVVSEAVLQENKSLLPATGDPQNTLKMLRNERKRCLRSAAALLRKKRA